jgi:transposase
MPHVAGGGSVHQHGTLDRNSSPCPHRRDQQTSSVPRVQSPLAHPAEDPHPDRADPFTTKQPRAKPQLDRVLPLIHQWLEADRDQPRKQRHTAERIYQRLRDHHQYTGGRTIIREAVAAWKQSQAEVFVPLVQPPGEAQVDFGEAVVVIAGERVTAAVFVLTLPHSDAFFVAAFPRECTETFQDGHARAFRYFGGVPTRISYDNSKIAVATIVGGRGDTPTKEFLRLASHFLFAHHFCRVRRPNEKGHVEAMVGYARRNFLVPIPEASSWEALNAELLRRCDADLARTVRGETQTKRDRLLMDRAALRALPEDVFEARRVEFVTANSLSLVRFDRNDYSVPTAFAHRPITVLGSVDEVRLMCREELVATHRRVWGREQVVFDPVHYLALLERKPGAFDFAKPLTQWHWPEPFAVLRRRFESAWGVSGGVRHFIQVLRLLEQCSLDHLTTAIEQSLTFGVTASDGVRVILEHSRETPVPLFSLDGHPQLAGVHVPVPDLTAYRVLQGGGS